MSDNKETPKQRLTLYVRNFFNRNQLDQITFEPSSILQQLVSQISLPDSVVKPYPSCKTVTSYCDACVPVVIGQISPNLKVTGRNKLIEGAWVTSPLL